VESYSFCTLLLSFATFNQKMLTMIPLSVATIAAAAGSPSRANSCIVKLTPMNGMYRYRNDPYRATVLPNAEPSPIVVRDAVAQVVRRTRASTFEHLPVAAPQPVLIPAALLPEHFEEPVEVAARVAASSRQPSSKPHFAVIKFKHDYATYIAPFKVAVGDCVSVEGDRGENIGMVTDITTEAPDFPVTQRVTRHAAKKDKDHLDMLRRKEAAATRTCQEIADQVGLNIKVVDTEYQFDMNKLTIFFSSKVPIDFRKFQRELFREFRCRIWIVNWPRKPAPNHGH